MARYVDGFVLPVPKQKLEAYRRMARTAGKVKSRAHRDKVLSKAMADPRLAGMMDPDAVPFDARRMFWGGFRTIVEL